MENLMNLYRYYLGADTALKRLDAVGLKADSVRFDFTPSFEGSDSENSNGVKYSMLYPRIYMDAIGFDFPNDLWRMNLEKRRAAEQPIREAKILEFAERYDDVSVIRDNRTACIYMEGMPGVGIRIDFGQALCERVQTGTRIKSIPDPEADVPMIEVEEPIYEYRCNDAELQGAI